MAMSFGRSLAVATLGVVLSGASLAHGAPEERAAARQQLNQARDAKKRGQPAEACQHLREAARLDPKSPSLSELLEVAECAEQQGELTEAQSLWALGRDRAKHDEKPQSRARAEERLAAVEKRIAHLTLQLAASPAGAQVLRDGVVVDAASLGAATALNPGEHAIVVTLAGHDDAKYAVKLADGDNQSLAIAPGPARTGAVAAPLVAAPAAPIAVAPVAPVVAASPNAPAPAPPPLGFWTNSRKIGAILAGVGVLGVAGGSVLCLAADSGKADARLAAGGASIAGGGVLLISGVILLVSAPSDDGAQHARSRVTPTLVVARDATLVGALGEF